MRPPAAAFCWRPAAAAEEGYDRRRPRKRQHCRWNKSDLRRVLLYSHTSPRPFASKAGLFYALRATLASLRHFRKTMISVLFLLAISLGVLSILAGAVAVVLVKDRRSRRK